MIQPPTRSSRIFDLLLVFCLGLFVNAYGISEGPLAGTEGHRALTAHQMVTSGQWLIPKLYDQYYLRKPPLDYWILGALEKLTGHADTFVWRIPSAVSSALMGAFFCWITARWLGRLAGLSAGISCCGMVAIWGQGRTAEIDALNSLACVVCACGLIDLGYGKRSRVVSVILWSGLAFGAAMMTKGPAGIAVILGALIGPAIFNRDWTPLKKPGWWIVLLIGSILFGIYCLAVWMRFRATHETPDTSGIDEVSYNFLEERLKNILHVLILPFTMLLYMMPMSLALLPAFGLWNARSHRREPAVPGFEVVMPGHPLLEEPASVGGWSIDEARLLRALVGTLIASCALTMLMGLAHERYSYVWAPMICPIVGVIAAAWQRKALSPSMQKAAPTLLGISVITFAVGCGGISGVYYLREHGPSKLPLILSVMSILIAIWAIVQLSRLRFAPAAWTLVPLIAFAAVPYALMTTANRQNHSTYTSAMKLKESLPTGTRVYTGNLLMDQPELFYYSGMDVKSYGDDKFLRNFDLPASGWIVLDDNEFNKNQNDPRMKKPLRLSLVGPAVVLAWYSVDGK